MFDNTMVRGSMVALRVAALCLMSVAAVSAVAHGQTVLPLTTTGAGSETIPAGYEWTNVTVQCWGAGGGAGGADYNEEGSGGGGGGAYAFKTYTMLPSGTYSYYVGLGGGGGGYNSNGSAGGNTIWDYGGVQDIYVTGGGGGSYLLSGGNAGSVVAGTGYQGGTGGSGALYAGGGGGGSAGPGGPGGHGGNASYGFGGIGGTGFGTGGVGAGNSSGGATSGSFPGGGGGGDEYANYRSPTAQAGANGEIVITYTPEALATVSLNAQNASIITGGTGTLDATVGNSASANLNLNYTLDRRRPKRKCYPGSNLSFFRHSRSECKPILHRLGHFH